MLGVLFFLVEFHLKLHTFKDTSSKKMVTIYFISFLLILSAAFLLVFGIGRLKYLNINHKRLYHLVTLLVHGVAVPKFYISKNPSLQLYVNVFHHHPSPVLPWQLPKNFDPTSVKLIHVNEQK